MIKKNGNNEIKTLSHSTYRCQYHILFAPKYRWQEIYGELRKDIGEIIRKLCEQKGVEIIEAEACKDHIHLLVSIPSYISVVDSLNVVLLPWTVGFILLNSRKPIFVITLILYEMIMG